VDVLVRLPSTHLLKKLTDVPVAGNFANFRWEEKVGRGSSFAFQCKYL